ncbi:MAG: DUF29 family protein [Aphanizomenon gracile PMC644.10]|nr:DUF29 family protein [Aphanizomenon gracile PMC638.10]MDM3850767.1 DUF29 family protein [Aphanizomenon gracile PMC627.10]MDM3861041.1 DUF29 family protein [Aphanizomenon gracile PMC644.10]
MPNDKEPKRVGVSAKILDKIYIKARNNAIRKSELSPAIFPENCVYSLTEILNPEWLPS